MRRTVRVSAGTIKHVATEAISYWHQHDLHEIEYALSGLAEIRTPTTHYLLPSQYAAWIPAGVPHSPLLQNVTTIAVFFDPAHFDLPVSQSMIFPVSPLLREMMRYAVEWPIGRDQDEEEARDFFNALANVLKRQLAAALPMSPLNVDDPLIDAAIEFTTPRIADVTLLEVCRSIGVSERVLRRRFTEVLGQSWRDYLQHARLLRAMNLLDSTDLTISQIAAEIGFGSASALARAFRGWTQESPSGYRARSKSSCV
jgi:AraC-like DNA-binding protein